MIKTIQKSAKTEDDAIELALRELGLDRDDVSVEIVERPKSGFLGIGSSPAIVAVTYEAPDEPEIPDSSPAPQTERRHEKRRSSPGSKSANADAGAVCDTHARRSAEGKTNEIREFIAGLLAHFGVAAEIEIGELRGDTIEVALMCAEPGALIGRRGETLEAIQSLTNYAVNKERGARLRVNVDTENYRARRAETLESLAEKTAAKVLRYRRSITLDPMNAYERHIIHAKLQEHASVSTHSVGSEPNRRVVVAYGDRGDGFIPRDRYSAPPRRDGRDRPRTARAPDRDAAPKPEPVREAYDNSSNAYSAAVDSPNYREWK